MTIHNLACRMRQVLIGLLPAFVAFNAFARDVVLLTPAPPNLPGFAPWILAVSKGYYKDMGYDVQLIAAKGSADVAKQVGAGNAPVGVGNGDTPIIVRSNGVPVKVVAVYGDYPHTLLALAPESDIESIADLRGKTVTVMSYSDSMYYTMLATLRTAGMSREDVNIQAAGPAGVWQLFADGKADAMAGAADWVVNVQDTGKQITLMPREKMFNAMSQAVIASDSAIENDPELVQAIVQGSLRALQDIANDPAQAAKDFAAAVPGYAHREDSVRRTFDLYLERIWATSTPGLIDPQRMQASVDFFLKEGLIRREEPLEHYFTNQFVAK